jgi:dipeptidyl aminopeptidase/acylaminoacyl peptidase
MVESQAGTKPAETRKTAAPYGSWRSPITADLIVQDSIRFDVPHVELHDGVAYWLERRPSERGRYVLVRSTEHGGVDVTPPFNESGPNFNVRTSVYEYGGGAWLVDEGVLYFSNFLDGRLYRQEIAGGDPEPLTPEERMPDDSPLRRYADGIVDRARKRWIGICEDWTKVDKKSDNRRQRYPKHRIVTIDLASTEIDPGTTLLEGHDFFASPRLSPEGGKLAWVAWDLPHMPWQSTTLYLANFDTAGKPASPLAIAGGPEESVMQPEWSPSGRELYFISDRSGWWNLYRYDVSSKELNAVAPMEAEFGQPQWQLAQSTYALGGDGAIVATYSKNGRDRLAHIKAAGQPSEINLPFTEIRSLRADNAGRVVFVGGSSRLPKSVVIYELSSGKHRVLKKETGLADNPAISQHLTDIEPITFPTAQNEVAHGLFYPPANADFTGPPEEKPPLIVMSHGGPTAQAESTLNFDLQYWTSRGIAVLDVNYRGSSGFGRAYRDKLKENWGIVDVEDCINGARYLVGRGIVDGERIVITGKSAGGYTTLAALTFHDYFRAGASHYGIGDLEALVKDTHKFESSYLDWLVGPYPEQIERYHERSPIHHVERLSRPVIFFQGEKDAIVPPNQAEAMVQAIKRRNLSVGYLLFANEQHGFREADNIRRSIEAAHYFFAFEVFRSQLSFGKPAGATH